MLNSNTCNHLTVCKQMTNDKLWLLYNNIWKYFVQKMSLGLIWKYYQQNVFTNPIYLIYMYKEDLALNIQQWLICKKTKQNLIKIFL